MAGMKKFVFSVLLIVHGLLTVATAQPNIIDLNGFRLHQTRESPINEFGVPDKSGRYDDGAEYDAFLLKENPNLYMVFEYPDADSGINRSIQITGSDPTTDLGFRGLRMGMSSVDVEKELGIASKKVDIGEYGTRWEYNKTNFSIEIGSNGKLSSVRIRTIAENVYPDPDVKKLPKFDVILKILTTGSNNDLAQIFAPDTEIYRDGKTLYFSHSMKTEIARDASKMFSTIRELAKELGTVNTKNAAEFEKNARIGLGEPLKHVMKFKKGGKVKEIVFKYLWGEFLVWEIDGGRPGIDELASYQPRTLMELTTTIPEGLFKKPNVILYDSQKKPDIRLSYNSFTSRVKVVYTGESRKIAERKRFVINIWLKTLGKPKEILDLFETEYLFKENNEEYWIPVQKAASAKLSKEFKKGDAAMIFVAWLGGRHEPKGFDNVLIVYDLKKDELQIQDD